MASPRYPPASDPEKIPKPGFEEPDYDDPIVDPILDPVPDPDRADLPEQDPNDEEEDPDIDEDEEETAEDEPIRA